MQLEIPTAPVFRPLLEKARYKAAYGGRGSGKSHFFAEMLVERAMMDPNLRAVCIREVQRTLAQSVKTLIEDKIRTHKLESYFEIRNAEIRFGENGLIIFQGMQNHTADSIKSLEGFDVAYVEEAQSLSEFSLRLLRPTIRKSGSEIWFAWNPRHEDDAVDVFFRGQKPPKNAVIVKANWTDNPWFPEELQEEKDHDYETNPEMAEHVWGGGYEIITEGSYYAKEVAVAEKQGRVGNFPYDPRLPVYTSWDIGVDDYTAIWYFQQYRDADNKPHVRIIDYYETSGDGADLIAQDAVTSKGYKYEMHYFPHDVAVREWGAGARSRYDTLRTLGVWPINKGARQKPEQRINAVRALLPYCEFDASAAVMLGLKRLRRYSRKWNESLGTYQGPLHDDNSHGADAFGEFAINSPLISAVLVEEEEQDTGYAPMGSYLSDESYEWL